MYRTLKPLQKMTFQLEFVFGPKSSFFYRQDFGAKKDFDLFEY